MMKTNFKYGPMQWFVNRPIKQKLMLVIVVVLVLFALLNTFTYINLLKTQTSSELVEKSHQVVDIGAAAMTALTSMESSYRGYLISGDEKFLQAFNQDKEVYTKQINRLKELTSDNPEQTKRWADIESWAQAWQSNVTDRGIMMRHAANDGKIKLEIIARFEGSGIGQQHFEQIASLLKDAINAERDLMEKRSRETANKNLGMRLLALWGTVIAFALSFPLLLVTAQAISRPMKEMSAIASSLALGDISKEVTHHSQDEIGTLADSFRSMSVYIHTISDACEALGRGDVTVKIEPRSEKDLIAKNFSHAVESVRDTIRQMSHSSAGLASSAEKLSTTSTQMRSNASETAVQADRISGAAEQMTVSIRQISVNAQEAAKVAGTSVKIATEASEKVSKLNESSQQIGQVVKVITTIAEQTHLLALNATIEAARAGEAGAGFAVVAGEVKELARETAKATEDIRRKIEAIQTGTKEAIDGIAEISRIVAQISSIQNTIASAVEEQTSTTNEITNNIGGMALAAKGTTEGAEYTNSAAGELASLASTLQSLVQQFEYGGFDHATESDSNDMQSISAGLINDNMVNHNYNTQRVQ
ncbi:MAG TPA: methyl-accepting chemotaxis protein [Candidatus Angelobacter sp.]|nr:methyl-accepting chemotaxis protein [Candidatus Angelobacter sp.]